MPSFSYLLHASNPTKAEKKETTLDKVKEGASNFLSGVRDAGTAVGDVGKQVASGVADMTKNAATEQAQAKAALAKGKNGTMGTLDTRSRATKNSDVVDKGISDAKESIEKQKVTAIEEKKSNIEDAGDTAKEMFKKNIEEAIAALSESLTNATTGDKQAIADTKAGFKGLTELFSNMSWDKMKPEDYDKLEYATILSKGIEKMFGVPATDFTAVSKDVALKKIEEMAATAQKLIDTQTNKENTKTAAMADAISNEQSAQNENVATTRNFDIDTVNDTIDAATNAEGKLDIESALDLLKSISNENASEFLAQLSLDQQKLTDDYELSGGIDAAMAKGLIKAYKEGQMTDREMLSKFLEAIGGVIK